mgnify:FL=1
MALRPAGSAGAAAGVGFAFAIARPDLVPNVRGMSEFRTIAVVGMGYVGLPLALHFARAGVEVVGLDVDVTKVEALNRGESYLRQFPSASIAEVVEAGRLEATGDFARIAGADAVILCVPTPLDEHREPDLSYVLNTARSVAPYLRGQGTGDGGQATGSGKLVVLESTTYPGTTEGELRAVLEEGSGLVAGEGFCLAYSPEREDPGRTTHSVGTIPKVVGGLTPGCRDRAEALYRRIVEQVVPVDSCRVAEATKLMENIFRSVNIALVNELKVVYDRMGIDVWEVIAAASTKPFGYLPFYPGPGLGGHCIPIDPFYLTWKAREYGQHTRFIELAGEINTAMPDYVIGKIVEALNDEGKAVRGSRIRLLGIAYKPNVDDDRESPSYVVWDKLAALGAEVEYYDPHVPVIRPSREHAHLAGQASREPSREDDLLVLLCHHEAFRALDYAALGVQVVDTRNVREIPDGLRVRA